VTVADFAAQAVIAHMLERSFPDASLVAEEDGTDLRGGAQEAILAEVVRVVRRRLPEANGDLVCRWLDRGGRETTGRFWTLDPIDGTKGFLRGGQYAVALALVEDGSLVLGALACPNLDRTLHPSSGGEGAVILAVRGEGAWARRPGGKSFRRLHVSSQRSASHARLLRSYEADHTDVAKLDRIAAILGVQTPPLRLDSQVKFALLASGLGELIVRPVSTKTPAYCEKVWDLAAGSLIVEEAGGRVTDLRGEALHFGGGRELCDSIGVLGSNGWLHEAALDAIRAAEADHRPEQVRE
jgi:3'(2'), 5'-bisphosphate nucleotidase